MINKCVAASGYNSDGSAMSKLGGAGRGNFVDRGRVIFNASAAVLNQDYTATGWFYSGELTNYNDYIFKAATFGCALSDLTLINDAGVSLVAVNGHSTGTYHTMKPGESVSLHGFVTSIWAANLVASGSSILRAIGLPVADITKMP